MPRHGRFVQGRTCGTGVCRAGWLTGRVAALDRGPNRSATASTGARHVAPPTSQLDGLAIAVTPHEHLYHLPVASKNLRKRERLFDAGSEALGLLGLTRTRHWYVCPLCGIAATREECTSGGHLELDHVPARAIGGRLCVLTCKTCNRSAGRSLEPALTGHHRLELFLLPPRQALAGRMAVGENSQPVRVWLADHVLQIERDLDRVQPAAAMVIDAELRERPTFSLTFETGDRRRAAVGMLKAAYLTAFAFFGYSWTMLSPNNIIRRQIAAPDEVILDVPAKYEPVERCDRFLVAVHELPALLYRWDAWSVLLPLSASDIYEELRRHPTVTWDHKSVLPLPARPCYVSDHRIGAQ